VQLKDEIAALKARNSALEYRVGILVRSLDTALATKAV
jgi:hypothetical protein